MSQHLFNVFYICCIIYLCIYWGIYGYLKFIKKDIRLNNCGFIYFLLNTRDVLNNSKQNKKGE